VTKVELFELVRQEYFHNGKSIRGLSKEHKIHRRMIRQAISSALPPPRKRSSRAPVVLTHAFRGVIDGWLVLDQEAPRKQRHTAHRIFVRLRDEHCFPGAEVTVRRYVRLRRREMGLIGEAFPSCPKSMRSARRAKSTGTMPTSIFRRAGNASAFSRCDPATRRTSFTWPSLARPSRRSWRDTRRPLATLTGSFRLIRYDNLASAVKKILSGRRREESDRFVALRSHYLFASSFCRPGKEGAHEKGGVEGGVGRFRRNHLVPVPSFRDFDELNRFLLSQCVADRSRALPGKVKTVEEDRQDEVSHLQVLPETPFSTAEVGSGRVDAKGLVNIKTNRYSVPIGLTGRTVEVRRHARTVEMIHGGRLVAAHERIFERFGIKVTLDHYLDLLRLKPGAFKGSLPLSQAKAAGTFPPLYDRLWEVLKQRYEKSEGTRQLVEVLLLHRQAPRALVEAAVTDALRLGCCDAGAIAVLVHHQIAEEEAPAPPLTNLGSLSVYDRPAGDVAHYNALLSPLGMTAVH
jgi:hypothetical protein